MADFDFTHLPDIRNLRSSLIHETLFSRQVFQLWEDVLLSQPLDDPDSLWVPSPAQPAVQRAQHSLIRWDGRADLGQIISEKFGIDTVVETGRRYYYQFGKPAVIRVLCTVDEKAPDITLAERLGPLRRLEIKTRILQKSEDERSLFDGVPLTFDYTAAAIVRLRDSRELLDLVRTYSVEGQQIKLPANFIWKNDHWSYSQQGTSSMIYFVEANPRSVMWNPIDTLYSAAEVAYTPPGWQEDMQKMKRCMATEP
ncbi:hypothetical protein F4810DRAFT_719470 [Camillea tinctor]|nr:hypothetical protein F4810DRAFT_719470 [Camillea tinctor]